MKKDPASMLPVCAILITLLHAIYHSILWGHYESHWWSFETIYSMALSMFLRLALRKTPGFERPDRGKVMCIPCGKSKPGHFHHCSRCNQCIPCMDHHCVWLGTCIGEHNRCMFCLMLAFFLIYLAHVIHSDFTIILNWGRSWLTIWFLLAMTSMLCCVLFLLTRTILYWSQDTSYVARMKNHGSRDVDNEFLIVGGRNYLARMHTERADKPWLG